VRREEKSRDSRPIGPRQATRFYGPLTAQQIPGRQFHTPLGDLSSKQASWVAPGVIRFLDTVRPNAVALVDARDISDFRLKSALGRYDGNVYPHIMEAARKDPLNAVDPGPAYDPELKRLISGGVGVYTGTASRL